MTTKRIPKSELPCRHYSQWSETMDSSVSGSRQDFDNCDILENGEEKLAVQVTEFLGGEDEPITCSSKCPGFDPVEPKICTRHNAEYIEVCDQCEDEIMEEMAKQEQI